MAVTIVTPGVPEMPGDPYACDRFISCIGQETCRSSNHGVYPECSICCISRRTISSWTNYHKAAFSAIQPKSQR